MLSYLEAWSVVITDDTNNSQVRLAVPIFGYGVKSNKISIEYDMSLEYNLMRFDTLCTCNTIYSVKAFQPFVYLVQECNRCNLTNITYIAFL